MTRYGMVIDLTRCFGCHACEAACKVSNNLPKEVVYNTVYTVGGAHTDSAAGEFPNCTQSYLPFQCQHCDRPSCMAACPTGATQKRSDGIVWVDEERCIGCRACMMACPYQAEHHVRTYLADEPDYYLDVVVGDREAPVHEAHTVEKCTFCHNLIDRGEVSACMQLCPGRARHWGDLDDPDSEVSQLIASRKNEQLLSDQGTGPCVYYLV